MDKFIQHGTTTVECKSGYGLNTESELKSLKVIHDVNKVHNIDMIATFMGGHAFPNEFQKNKSDYVDLICNEMIPKVQKQGIAKFIDVFCEDGYFNIEQTKKIIEESTKSVIDRIDLIRKMDSNISIQGITLAFNFKDQFAKEVFTLASKEYLKPSKEVDDNTVSL